jgi:diaminohydroxyphosphoribosylaminopyrimidine deaminase/5-amino-6-(5-phosphoribosylamino)uracil reductase
MTPADDERFMRRALALAERARGLTSPNPLVGAVVVRDGEVVGEGFHAAAGRPHAEVIALAAAGDRARGATLYVTLEPCVHHGRTPPCLPEVLQSGVARVVIGAGDPNPLVGGRGIEALRAAGLAVTAGVLADEAARQNRPFFTAMREGRPHVTLKAAATLDGRIADVDGGSRWITGEAARREAHRLRSEHDAIVVGLGTVRRDDPALTVRLDRLWPREPWRVVLDTLARTPPAARLITAATPARALIAVGPGAAPERVAALEAAGATVLHLPARGDRVDVAALLAALHAREVRAVLVEGGAEVHASFLDLDLVDRVAIFLAPRLLGGRSAPGVVGGRGRRLDEAVRLAALSVRPVGDDLLVEADVVRPVPAADLRPGRAAPHAVPER